MEMSNWASCKTCQSEWERWTKEVDTWRGFICFVAHCVAALLIEKAISRIWGWLPAKLENKFDYDEILRMIQSRIYAYDTEPKSRISFFVCFESRHQFPQGFGSDRIVSSNDDIVETCNLNFSVSWCRFVTLNDEPFDGQDAITFPKLFFDKS